MDGDELSNIPFDQLEVGLVRGPYIEHVSAHDSGLLAGRIGEPYVTTVAPPAVFPVLFLKALRRSMGGIPAGSILAKQELEFWAELPVDSDVSVTTWVGERFVKRERPTVVIEFDVRDLMGDQIITGRKTIIWPTGPGEV